MVSLTYFGDYGNKLATSNVNFKHYKPVILVNISGVGHIELVV